MSDQRSLQEYYRRVIIDMLKGDSAETLLQEPGVDVTWIPVVTAAFVYVKAAEKKCAPITIRRRLINRLIKTAMTAKRDDVENCTVQFLSSIGNAIRQLRGTNELRRKLKSQRLTKNQKLNLQGVLVWAVKK